MKQLESRLTDCKEENTERKAKMYIAQGVALGIRGNVKVALLPMILSKYI